jgi:hypothetical protein
LSSVISKQHKRIALKPQATQDHLNGNLDILSTLSVHAFQKARKDTAYGSFGKFLSCSRRTISRNNPSKALRPMLFIKQRSNHVAKATATKRQSR